MRIVAELDHKIRREIRDARAKDPPVSMLDLQQQLDEQFNRILLRTSRRFFFDSFLFVALAPNRPASLTSMPGNAIKFRARVAAVQEGLCETSP